MECGFKWGIALLALALNIPEPSSMLSYPSSANSGPFGKPCIATFINLVPESLHGAECLSKFPYIGLYRNLRHIYWFKPMRFRCLASMTQSMAGVSSYALMCHMFNSQSGHILILKVWSPVVACMGYNCHVSLSPPFFSLSLRSKKTSSGEDFRN